MEVCDEYVIDVNVQRLIEESCKDDGEEEIKVEEVKARSKPRRGKKKKSALKEKLEESDHKKKKKKRINKTKKSVSFSLSKPPSPQTEQVIRVDVTSNCPIDSEFTRLVEKEVKKVEHLDEKRESSIVTRIPENCSKTFLIESRKAILFNRA